MAGLTLSVDVEEFTLGFVADDPWVKSLAYKEGGVRATWPAAPVIEFDDPALPDWVATLSTFEGVENSLATWDMPASAVNALAAAESKKVRFVVAGRTWFAGKAAKNA